MDARKLFPRCIQAWNPHGKRGHHYGGSALRGVPFQARGLVKEKETDTNWSPTVLKTLSLARLGGVQKKNLATTRVHKGFWFEKLKRTRGKKQNVL